MIFLKLFFEFFKTGLFSIGGGYATIPFLYQISISRGWYSIKELSDILAISVITPGPVGVNMATYAGFKTTGLLGAICATISLVIPSYFIVILVCKIIKKYNENPMVQGILYALKPASFGMLFAVFLNIIKSNINSIPSVIVFSALFIITFFFKKNPSWYFLFAIIIGLILNFFKFLV